MLFFGAVCFSVVIDENAPSAEGPLRAARQFDYRFRTYGPFTISSHRPPYTSSIFGIVGNNGKASPGDGYWTIQFTNAVDQATFDLSLFTFTPQLADLKIQVNDRVATIRGNSLPNTKYECSISCKLMVCFSFSF